MSVIPLITGGDNPTVVSNRQAFAVAGAFDGSALLITNMDELQLRPDEKDSHLSYDLRVGPEYKDHRERQKQGLPEGGEITLLPGVAVIVLTEENVCLPRSMFGYIIPRVSVLQRGISNIVSKIDPGYDGPLVITLFNLGKRTETLKRGERICSLVMHQVLAGGGLYGKGAQLIHGEPKTGGLNVLIDWVDAHAGAIASVAIIISILEGLSRLLR